MSYLKIKVRNDLLENWVTYNPILKEDELAVVKIKKKLKFKKGDGKTPFIKLPFLRTLSDIGSSFCLYPENMDKVSIELDAQENEEA